MTVSLQDARRLRLLVVIANYGQKNLEFLKEIIRTYRSFEMDVDIIVVSEAPKKLDCNVRVIVGLPHKNPWSLPFAHKQVFVENVDRYDLFAYSEDDILITEANVHAFLRITPALAPDEIAGFLRYEIDQVGTLSLPDVLGAFHWKPQTVRHRGGYSLAEFSNEHAAFYLLTQSQLKRAITSCGYLRGPYEGRYDMLCSAATDPYTCCGFHKVICISALENFLIHHMPNTYVGRVGLPLSSFKEQIQTMIDIEKGIHPASSLCEVEPKVLQRNWYKSYYENSHKQIIDLIPRNLRNVLSIGCGWGATEVEFKKRGAKVTALPLDSVIGAVTARHGIEMIYGTIQEGLRTLRGRRFDCVLITNLLHLLHNPYRILSECASLVEKGGMLVITGPNFEYLPHLAKRILRVGDYCKLGDFELSGLHAHGIKKIQRHISRAGFRVTSSRWFDFPQRRPMFMAQRWLKRFVAKNWALQACRQ